MENGVHTFLLRPDWQLINAISKLDRFDASWIAIEKREGKNLKHLKSIATVRSVGASTRIEGSRMSDDEVKVLIVYSGESAPLFRCKLNHSYIA